MPLKGLHPPGGPVAVHHTRERRTPSQSYVPGNVAPGVSETCPRSCIQEVACGLLRLLSDSLPGFSHPLFSQLFAPLSPPIREKPVGPSLRAQSRPSFSFTCPEAHRPSCPCLARAGPGGGWSWATGLHACFSPELQSWKRDSSHKPPGEASAPSAVWPRGPGSHSLSRENQCSNSHGPLTQGLR